MRRIKLARQHYLNPLHIYCRLIDVGFGRVTARKISIFLTITI